MELQSYNQWLLWQPGVTPEGKSTKWPISPHTMQRTDVTNPSSWDTFAKVTAIAQSTGLGVGFALTASDPFFCVDLDNPYKDTTPEQAQARIEVYTKILAEFDTYIEASPNKGLHIWGLAPGAEWDKGHKRNGVEIYCANRFMTVTGQPWRDAPLKDCSYAATRLWEETASSNGNHNVEVREEPETQSDRGIYETAKDAVNGTKFLQLWDGNWSDVGYGSQSEADFALVNIIGFYSRNKTQIKRMFHLSALGKRAKSRRKDYIDTIIQRSFDNLPVYVPLDELVASVKDKVDSSAKTKSMLNPSQSMLISSEVAPLLAGLPDPNYDWTMPPGLLGDIAEFIYQSSPRPVKEIALAASIGFMAGICGRAYNVSDTGLNQYVLILARTGTGKEAAASGIDKLVRHVRVLCPSVTDYIGPTEIASGQALVKYLASHPCFVSIVGEFGLMLQAMCSFNANGSQITLRKKLLELYSKSGAKQIMQPTIYSDKDKNTAVVQSPSFSILGESTPESYYGGLDETMIAQGLLPRFMCIEYLGKRPDLNHKHAFIEPKTQLISMLAELAANTHALAANQRVIGIKLDEAADKYADEVDRDITRRINNSELHIAQELWNRGHLKMLKLAALIAVGMNIYEPVITLPCVQWAHALVERDVNNILERFDSGKVGKDTSEVHQLNEVKRIIREYIYEPFGPQLQKYLIDPRMKTDRVIPHSYMARRLLGSGAFKNDRIGATNAITRTVTSLVSDGVLVEIKQLQVHQRYGKSSKVYFINDVDKLT